MKAEKKEIEKFFTRKFPDKEFTLEQCISLYLMLEGEKPGVLIMSASKEQVTVIEKFCEEFDCYSRTYSGVGDPGLFVTRDKQRFEILEESDGKFYSFSDEAVGEFLGYEEDARKFYVEKKEDNLTANQLYREKLEELGEKGETDEEELKSLELVSYIPYPDKEHILQAVQEGKERRKILEDTETGGKYLEELEKQAAKGKVT